MIERIVAHDPAFPIGEIREADYNPKTFDPSAKEALRTALERFGIVEPIILNQHSNRIINGHQKLTIWREIGHDTIPVNFVEVDEITEKKMNLDLNNPHIEGEWETDKLAALQGELKDYPLFEKMELGFINTGIVRREEITEEKTEDEAVSTTGYLKVFRLHFLPQEWEFFESKGKKVMAEQNMTSYSELVLWLAQNAV